MTKPIALVDLDDTLFQTIRKAPRDMPAGALTPLGFAKDGSPLSYATPRQKLFIDWLVATTHFVPVTARGRDALYRVRIPFIEAVCAHGGVVIGADGQSDPVWAAHIERQAADHARELSSLVAAVDASAAAIGTAVAARVLMEGDIGLYVLAKHPDADDARLNAAVDGMIAQIPADWTVHRNGNNIAIMPPYLGKAYAVAHLLPVLRARHGDVPVIAIGDSLTDLGYMALADFGATPVDSQIVRHFRDRR